MDESRPIFLQVAEQIENDIIMGALAEEDQVPSTNEFAAFHRINPATAAKGIAMLTDKGVLYKRRGLGMFVTPGAREILLAKDRELFVRDVLDPVIDAALVLGLSPDVLTAHIDRRMGEKS